MRRPRTRRRRRAVRSLSANRSKRRRRSRQLPHGSGAYRIERKLGEGGFGLVYLSFDEQLERLVAVKVPHSGLVSQPEDAEPYLHEARAVASLDHPNIVPVYDVGGSEGFPCYVVSKFIDGQTLSSRIRGEPFNCRQAAALVATVAEALHHAHNLGIVHRDVKPGNILIDQAGKPYVVDFGLALREADIGKGPRYAGTPTFMSPEQAWGEGHRVDGRSDVFSLGIVFYLLLSGRVPFSGCTREELLEQITCHEPKPPRQIDDQVPRELDRICLKALAKRAWERYSTAADMAEDLRFFLGGSRDSGSRPEDSPRGVEPATVQPAASSRSSTTSNPTLSLGTKVQIVPRGLRSFDEQDADFFLELLPGARDRHGMPEILRFWKHWVEQTDADRSSPVGLIYGPSGCGKSSLVKAGLLPRLPANVLAVYVEATPQDTETRLLVGLRQRCPGLPEDSGLREIVAALRQGNSLPEGRKVLVVLDQFEQWLHARREDENTLLVQALRQCDGTHVQCLVMVRDDFWMASTRFMKALEIRLVDGQNSAAVDLFDPAHARKVLASFGRAFGNLPRSDDQGVHGRESTYRDQESFLKEAVAGLTQDGKVVCVRLALFAEMMKGKSWNRGTLAEVGGTRGVGLTFLEENFSASTAPPAHRLHQQAARGVLKALLPELGTDIKGHMRSCAELLEASGYQGRRAEFDELMHILDAELRLITPTDPDGLASTGDGAARRDSVDGYYQLTHDYLVHSLRDWLTSKQRETRRGRAELLLEERSLLWTSRPETRFLPSLWEWVCIRLLTGPKHWTTSQRAMVRRAGRKHGLASLTAVGLLALTTWGVIEASANLAAAGIVDSLKTSRTADVPSIIDELAAYRRWADPLLRRLLRESAPSSRAHLHASMALLADDPSQVDFLTDRLLTAATPDLPVLCKLLQPRGSTIVPRLWDALGAAKPGDLSALPAAAALAQYAPEDAQWSGHANQVAERLAHCNPLDLPAWLELFRPARAVLLAPLAEVLRDRSPRRTESEREIAATLLSDYAADQPALLADLLMHADPVPFAALLRAAEKQANRVAPILRAETRRATDPAANPADAATADELAARRARAAAALIRMDRAVDAFLLLRSAPDPGPRSHFIHGLQPLGIPAERLAGELARLNSQNSEAGAAGKHTMQAILQHPQISSRRALILALGTYPASDLAPELFTSLCSTLLDLYRSDPDSGIHGAVEWTLKAWGRVEELRRVDLELSRGALRKDRRWYVNSLGQTLAVVDGPVEFLMGSPDSEPHRGGDETQHRRIIPRRFAIATKEVSHAELEKFLKEHPELGSANRREFSPDPACPASKPSWYAAAAFCNWLSDREHCPRCYDPAPDGLYGDGMRVPADALTRTGYRLPTEAEWEFTCRAGTLVSRYCGAGPTQLSHYGYFNMNSDGHAWPCGQLMPNDLGLFDMLGNVYEWCQDRWEPYQPSPAGVILDLLSQPFPVLQTNRYILRGGGFVDVPGHLRAAQRSFNTPNNQLGVYGFRIARTLPAP